MASITSLKLGAMALLGLGAADVAWINLSIGPRVLAGDGQVASAAAAEVVPAERPPERDVLPADPAVDEPPVMTASATAPLAPSPVAPPPPELTTQAGASVGAGDETAVKAAPPTPAAVPAANLVKQVYFESKSTRIGARARALLAQLRRSAGPSSAIHIEGHTDYRGDERFNEDLSKDRADAAAAYLIKLGVSASQIRRDYFGERGATEAPADELWRDRRVDIRIIEGGPQ
jgi:outer membrane protein OmpA-like peptidoglycan-associated protein